MVLDQITVAHRSGKSSPKNVIVGFTKPPYLRATIRNPPKGCGHTPELC